MKRQQATRRWILGALVVGAVAATALGTGGGARAVEDDGAYYTGGYGSRAGFKKVCDGAKGTFIDDGNGNLECHFKDGSWTECDANGGDCWHTPPPKKLEPVDTTVEPDSAVADDPGGWQPATHVTDIPTPSQAQASIVALDEDPVQDQDQGQDTTKKGKKGKHGKKGGKGRK
jgi:hypothetical protein